jgi:UDPglucose--hexose-1-phosphate uridylyltransferase
MFDIREHSNLRLNILTGEWVLVSPHRSKRPWQGKLESDPAINSEAYDAACYLCPGNERMGGERNPKYESAYSFTNDFGSVIEETPDGDYNNKDLLRALSARGICKVVCFSPRHDLTLPQMDEEDIVKVIELWRDEFQKLASHEWIKYIQIFENKGQIMGCSNPHPHSQIWSLNDIPAELLKEGELQKKHFVKQGTSLLSDYLKLELEKQERIVYSNEHFVVLVPFWAVWPFETLIISKRHIQNILEFSEEEIDSLAYALKHITTLYDNLFNTSFPYSAGMHQSPVNNGVYPEWHWHMHFYPPLLRSSTVKKFMVGYELLASPQRDVNPEWVAEKLRSLPAKHYLQKEIGFDETVRQKCKS